MTHDEAREALYSSGLGDMAQRVEPFLHPSIRLKLEPRDLGHLPLGTSRFGGAPDLPPGTAWPEREGRALAFVAQIRMADLRFAEAAELGVSGWLVFFYDCENQAWGFDPADGGSWRVLHINCPLDDLERTTPVSVPGLVTFASCAIRFEVEYRLPPVEVVCGTLEIDFNEQQENAFESLIKRVNRPKGAHHRMFGWPDCIQGDMRLECQLASNGVYCGNPSCYDDPRAATLEPGQHDWVLLLQVDSDEKGPGWMWGDCGRIYFWIREQDLAARTFDGVWLVLQCY